MARSSSRRTAPKGQKRSNKGRRSRRRSHFSPLHAILWFAGGLGLGLLILLPFYFFGGEEEKEPAPAEEEQGPPQPDRPPEPRDVPPPQPQSEPGPEGKSGKREGYRFYTLLPEMKVEVPDAPDEKDTPQESAPVREPERSPSRAEEPDSEARSAPKPANAGDFLVQVGSFRTPDAAESLKARLALKNLQAKIVRADLGARGTWHRVRLGPYADRAAAEAVHRRLEADGLDSLVMQP